MTEEAEPEDGIPEEVMVELRRQIFARLAVARPDGSLVLCSCSYTRAAFGRRPKITYADYDDARTAALALVKLPGATPIRLQPCSRATEPKRWHHTKRLGKGKAGRKYTIYPASWPDDARTGPAAVPDALTPLARGQGDHGPGSPGGDDDP